MDRSEKRNLILVLAVAFLASLAWCLTKGRMVEGDDAIMGLMALKISRGEEFPVFFWQAHYSGPIASYLAAPLHWLFDPSPIVLHSVIIPIHMFYSAGMYFLARSWLGQREAMMAGLFAALPGQLFPYSALGGFTESMALVPWIFLLCLGERKSENTRNARFFCGGLLCGFALWVFPLAFPPVLACLICQQRAYGGRSLKLSLAGCFLGLLPAIFHNISQPGATFLRLFARPSALDRQAASHILSSEGIISFFLQLLEKWACSSYQALLNIPQFTLSLFGLTADATLWSHISGFITVFALLFGLQAFFRYQGNGKIIPRAMLMTVIITFGFLILFGLNRDRYLIPILLTIPFGLALTLRRLTGFLSARFATTAVFLILLVNCFSNFWDTKTRYPDYEGLARFLQANGLDSGYANYLTAYPLVYLSNERLIYTPSFHEPEYDRNAKYTALAIRSKSPSFVFDSAEKAASFRAKLSFHGIAAMEATSGHYIIIYELNPPIAVDKLK